MTCIIILVSSASHCIAPLASSCQRFWNKMMEQSGGDWTGRDTSSRCSGSTDEEKDERLSAAMSRVHVVVDVVVVDCNICHFA